MCEELDRVGWPRNPSALSKKERSGIPKGPGNQRTDTLKVNVDDLAPFSQVFAVEVADLLTPVDPAGSEAYAMELKFTKALHHAEVMDREAKKS